MICATERREGRLPKNAWAATRPAGATSAGQMTPLVLPRYSTWTLSFRSNAFKTSFMW